MTIGLKNARRATELAWGTLEKSKGRHWQYSGPSFGSIALFFLPVRPPAVSRF